MMSTSGSMTPLTRVLDKVRSRGYACEISIGKKGARFSGSQKWYLAGDLSIRRVYRFEGESDPADMSILYILTSKDEKEKGFLISAYGAHADQDNPYYEDFIVDVFYDEREDFENEYSH